MVKQYKPGHIFNDTKMTVADINRSFNSVKIKYPSRLESMVLDPSLIDVNDRHQYNAGQINFKINLFTDIEVVKNNSDKDTIHGTDRISIVLHAVELMRHKLKINDFFNIDVEKELDIKHAGFGSSSNLIAATMCAINELYGSPIQPEELVVYAVHNHVEEAEVGDQVVPVQCLGGSACAGFFNGGLQILAGYTKLIYKKDLPKSTKIIFAIPESFKEKSAENLMNQEVDNMEGFKQTGTKYAREISYRLVHNILPALEENPIDLKTLGELIFDYRFKMGSIKNCSFAYPEILPLSQKIEPMFETGKVSVLALSSVGPGFFAIVTSEQSIDVAEEEFHKLGMKTYDFKPYNEKFQLLSLQ